MHNTRRWISHPTKPTSPAVLTSLGLPAALVRLLLRRGIDTPEAASAFLDPSLSDLPDPWTLPGIALAVEHIREAIFRKHRIAVYGDYDADGITSTAIMVLGLRSLGADVVYELPDRLQDGYGMSERGLSKLADLGCRLVITVDNGTSCSREVAFAKTLGIDVIITDHHDLPSQLPEEAVVLINPKLNGWPSNSTHLAGVGVAYYLVTACCSHLQMNKSIRHNDYLDLVALGTIADVSPLLGDNRILVRHGLNAMRFSPRLGLRELVKVSGIGLDNLDETSVAYGLAPRINAAGRLSDPRRAVELLLATDESTATELASVLDAENRDRQKQEKHIIQEAVLQAQEQMAGDNHWALVLASDAWHHGIVGIVASRLVEKFHRPIVMLTVEGGLARGSARSIPGFHIANALAACSHLLVKYGGHEGAAGLTIDTQHIGSFRTALVELAKDALIGRELIAPLDLDDELAADEVTDEFARMLERMAPYGAGNRKPVFILRGLMVSAHKYVGEAGNHLKVRFVTRGLEVDGVGFGLSRDKFEIPDPPVPMDAAFCLELNKWGGRQVLQMNIKDLRPTSSSESPAADISRLYGRLEVSDRRSMPDKKDALRYVIDSGEPIIVYLRLDGAVERLASAIQSEWPHKLGRVMFCHSQTNDASTADVVSGLASGKCDILVTSRGLAHGAVFPGLAHVVLYHPCSSIDELARLVSMSTGASRVILHLLYDGRASDCRNCSVGEAGGFDRFVDMMSSIDAAGLLDMLWATGRGEGR